LGYLGSHFGMVGNKESASNLYSSSSSAHQAIASMPSALFVNYALQPRDESKQMTGTAMCMQNDARSLRVQLRQHTFTSYSMQSDAQDAEQIIQCPLQQVTFHSVDANDDCKDTDC
jgi:hypothetical protein